MTEPLILQARAKAGIDDARQALTDPKILNLWLGEHSTVDLPGTFEFWGRYIPEGDAPHQRVLGYDGQTLKLAWLLGGEETTTEISLLEESDDSTVIKLSQSHFKWSEAVSNSNISPTRHSPQPAFRARSPRRASSPSRQTDPRRARRASRSAAGRLPRAAARICRDTDATCARASSARAQEGQLPTTRARGRSPRRGRLAFARLRVRLRWRVTFRPL